MARTRDSSLWISRNQSSILRGAHRAAPRKGFAVTETGDLPFGQRLLFGGHSRWPKRGYDYGLYPPGRPDDGYTIRFCGPRNPHLFNATRAAHRAAARRLAEHQIRLAGNFWGLGRHAADRGRDEGRPSAG